jgi:hypothetical protein
MMEQIKIFLLVLSVVYLSKFIIEFIIKLMQDNPEPMKISKVEEVIQLLSSSYIITYFLI